jgi:hypothetical protein
MTRLLAPVFALSANTNSLCAGIFSATNVQLAHLILQRRSFQSKALGRSTFARYPSGRALQRVDNYLPLRLLECRCR